MKVSTAYTKKTKNTLEKLKKIRKRSSIEQPLICKTPPIRPLLRQAISWTFNITSKDGQKIEWNKVRVRSWKNEKAVPETCYQQ